MRFLSFSLLVFIFFCATVSAWDKDHEIFDLVSAIEASEGKGTTFYSWLDVPSTASTPEIAKAYRKLSMKLHPDKNPGKKKVAERFARLGVVSAILRNPVSRKRYDFFYKNGVPKWRGTGYYYSRFRPGLGTVSIFLIVISSGMQYLIQRSNYQRDLKRVEDVVREARLAAWGPKMVPVEGQRKVKVNLGGRQRYDEDGNLIGGKTIDMVVSGDAVYVLDPDGDMHPVDSCTAVPATVRGTWFITLVLSAYSSSLKKVKGGSTEVQPVEDVEIDDGYDSAATGSEQAGSGTVTPQEGAAGGYRKPATKAGGKRRKAVRKR
ncbi:DnaJ-domain-containing protein [Lentinula aciculospora]|uniref:DnaJ-domain-containing protein n=1 Tax=Lentinula aciculospora TaxID=153920 RepID=A0A9W9AAC6_9AGAR|nr:DnaJ-domain-containing protein [Lentinula aciculospora]